MTRTEIERLAVVEEKIDTMKESVDKLEASLADFIKCADKRYASKMTERLVYGLVSVVLLAVVYTILEMMGLHV